LVWLSFREWAQGSKVVSVSGLGWALRQVNLLVCQLGWLFWLGMGFVNDDQPKQDTSLKDPHFQPAEPSNVAN
jgi:hypothetical protein